MLAEINLETRAIQSKPESPYARSSALSGPLLRAGLRRAGAGMRGAAHSRRRRAHSSSHRHVTRRGLWRDRRPRAHGRHRALFEGTPFAFADPAFQERYGAVTSSRLARRRKPQGSPPSRSSFAAWTEVAGSCVMVSSQARGRGWSISRRVAEGTRAPAAAQRGARAEPARAAARVLQARRLAAFDHDVFLTPWRRGSRAAATSRCSCDRSSLEEQPLPQARRLGEIALRRSPRGQRGTGAPA